MHRPADMACREFVELVTDYLEGKLTRDLAARFEAHLEVCTGCSLYLGQMRLTVQALRGHGHVPLGTHLRTRLLAQYRELR